MPRQSTQFKPGVSGNPKGRPKGSRNKFTERFLKDFIDDWKRYGNEALHAVRTENPAAYLRVAASLLGKDEPVEVTVTHKESSEGLRTVEENIKMILDEIDKQ